MFVLAHLSDPHVASRLRLGWRDLVSKRVLGYLSWQMRRRHIHRLRVLDALAADLRTQAPDHVAVTGDITNIALPAEFPAAARWLAGLGRPEQVSVIPGNHDAYVALAWERSWKHWDHYMRSDADHGPRSSATGRFPYLRRRSEVAIVGLSTAVATGPGLALGELGAEQMRDAHAMLARLREEGAFRIVLIHHPPIAAPGHRHKRLTDAAAFLSMLGDVGAELVLHGHDHRRRLYRLASRDGEILSVGAASASAMPIRGHAAADYNLFRIGRCEGGWTVDMRVRALDPTHRFTELHRQPLTVLRAHAPRHFADAGRPVAADVQ
jgi:Predicted phosphohydrolases